MTTVLAFLLEVIPTAAHSQLRCTLRQIQNLPKIVHDSAISVLLSAQESAI